MIEEIIEPITPLQEPAPESAPEPVKSKKPSIEDILNEEVQHIEAPAESVTDALKKDLKDAGEISKTGQVNTDPYKDFSDKTSGGKSSESIKKLANAKLIISMFDMAVKRIMPMIPPLSHTTPEYWELNDTEKDELREPLQELIDKHNAGDVSPEVALVVCVLIVYGFKWLAAMDSKPKEEEPSEPISEMHNGEELQTYTFSTRQHPSQQGRPHPYYSPEPEPDRAPQPYQAKSAYDFVKKDKKKGWFPGKKKADGSPASKRGRKPGQKNSK